ncbi:MAG: hypothetical protein V4547_18965 [Bacteroidota bacterium]
MKTETLVKYLQGDGSIRSLEKSIKEAKKLGATDFHVHIQNERTNAAYVQMIEFTKTLTEQEVFLNEINTTKEALKELENKYKLKYKA